MLQMQFVKKKKKCIFVFSVPLVVYCNLATALRVQRRRGQFTTESDVISRGRKCRREGEEFGITWITALK